MQRLTFPFPFTRNYQWPDVCFLLVDQEHGDVPRRYKEYLRHVGSSMITALDRSETRESRNLHLGRTRDRKDTTLRKDYVTAEPERFLDWRLNSDNDSRLHGQPSSSMMCPVSFSLRVLRSQLHFHHEQ